MNLQPHGLLKTGEERCEARGHTRGSLNKWEEVSGYQLCTRCWKWFPRGDKFGAAMDHIPLGGHFSGMLPQSAPNNIGFNELIQKPHPFAFLRDNPEILDEIDHLTIRKLVIDRLADYEMGLDDEGHE